MQGYHLHPCIPVDFANTLPFVDLPHAWIGSTQYIDCVKPEEMQDTSGNFVSALKGVDIYGRPAICFQIVVENLGRVVENSIYTLFQRYTNDVDHWVCCPSHFSKQQSRQFLDYILETPATVSEHAAHCLRTLFTDGTLNYRHFTVRLY